MSIIRKIKSIFHDDWCYNCQTTMEIRNKKLFMLPMSVGHYKSHQNADYYINNLIRVNKKADIPVGYYACGIYQYKCPNCKESLVKLSIFLPVRDQEKTEEFIYFKKGELDTFIDNN